MSEHLFAGPQGPEGKENPESGEEVKKEFKDFVSSSRKFLQELLELRSNTDQAATRESIIADIPFKGHTSWILICSIFIASIGLNADSTAVVIGAMLISPLMGPILGTGMSLAINDIDLMRRSLRNFLVMVVLSVLTAFLFFAIFPLRDESSELLARTKPDIRDVLIAFFGGLALVIARAKKGTIASVIFGVAIATALMPPLCTVGYGLAVRKYDFALQAMYLFTINSVFIALATYAVIKYLRFPMVRYANSQRRRLIARLITIVGFGVMIFPVYTFYKVLQESLYEKEAYEFIKATVEKHPFEGNTRYEDDLTEVVYDPENGSLIEVTILGEEGVDKDVERAWRAALQDYSRLEGCTFRVLQGGKGQTAEDYKYLQEVYANQKDIISTKDGRIQFLEEEVSRLRAVSFKEVDFGQISTESTINYPDLESLRFAYVQQFEVQKQVKDSLPVLDTIPVFEVRWKKSLKPADQPKTVEQMQKWLRERLGNKKIQVITLPNT